MAADKLIDSTKEAACRTAEANAIRAKTGGTGQLNYDWTNSKGFADAISAIPSGGGKNVQYSTTVAKVTNKTSYTSVGGTITVAKTGNYKCTWVHYAYAAGSTSTYATQLYAGGSAKGSAHSCPAYNGSSGWSVTENSISLTAGQSVEVRARTRSGSSYWTVAGQLVIEEL